MDEAEDTQHEILTDPLMYITLVSRAGADSVTERKLMLLDMRGAIRNIDKIFLEISFLNPFFFVDFLSVVISFATSLILLLQLLLKKAWQPQVNGAPWI